MKGCFFGAQFLNKRPDKLDRSLIGDPTGYATKKLDLVVEFDAFFTHGAARQNYLPHYDDLAVNLVASGAQMKEAPAMFRSGPSDPGSDDNRYDHGIAEIDYRRIRTHTTCQLRRPISSRSAFGPPDPAYLAHGLHQWLG
jgi:hypothetical protein